MSHSVRAAPREARLPPASPPAPPPASGAKARDARIDVIRGLALVMIFINHVPGTWFESLTNRNFGFSDAAEAFVLLAGVSAALAYGRGFLPQASASPLWPRLAKIWGRAWTLYTVHITISLLALGIVALTLRWGGVADLILIDNFGPLFHDPVGVFVGLPLMLHQFGYVNILPLYAILLLAAPLALWLGQRRPLWLLAISLALWLAAGTSRINLLTYPGLNGWFLNPFSWQLIFTIGLLTGLAMRRGERLLPVHPVLVAAAAFYVLLALAWVRIPAVREIANAGMVALSRAGAPRLVTHFDKGFLELPRLLHILSLAYLVSAAPTLARLAEHPILKPLALMGRQALPVFALGTLLSFAARGIREVAMVSENFPPVWLDPALILGGILLQVLFAALREASVKACAPAPQPSVPPQPAADPWRLLLHRKPDDMAHQFPASAERRHANVARQS